MQQMSQDQESNPNKDWATERPSVSFLLRENVLGGRLWKIGIFRMFPFCTVDAFRLFIHSALIWQNQEFPKWFGEGSRLIIQEITLGCSACPFLKMPWAWRRADCEATQWADSQITVLFEQPFPLWWRIVLFLSCQAQGETRHAQGSQTE